MTAEVKKISFEDHKANGHVWLVDLENPCGTDEEGYPFIEKLKVEIVAPTQVLAQYVVECMYPQCLLISVPDSPMC
jgi:hypothetical protein